MFPAVERFAPAIRKMICPLFLSPRTVTPVTSPDELLSPPVSAYGGPPCDDAEGTSASASAAANGAAKRHRF